MAPETSTQTDTRGEAVSPVTSTATSAPPLPHHEQHQHQHQQLPVQEHFAPAMPSTAQHVDHRGSAAIPQQPHQPYVLYPASYGEHYVPYEQSRQADMLRQGHAQGAQVVAPRIIVPETKSWRMTKDVLHVLAMVMSIAGIGIGISLASNSYSGLMGTLVSVPIFGVALIWSLAEMITRATTHWGPGIHPGAHVGMCLILWIAAVIAGGCCATVVAIADDDCESTYRSSRYYDDNCFYGRTRGRFLGLAILLIGLFVAEFILFVGGCIDTNKRNKARSNAPVMIVAQPGMYPHAMMQQQQQQQQQQPPQQPMAQQYFAPQHAYHPQQFSAMPPHAQAPAHARAMPEGSERTREKQPEGTQPAITEFYSPAGPGRAV